MTQTKRKEHLQNLKGDWTLAELTISYKTKPNNLPILTSPESVYKFIDEIWDKRIINMQEQFTAVFLNRANKVIGYRVISTGTMSKCIVDIRLLISLALITLADSVIVSHNHPSGNLKPSRQDEAVTQNIKGALNLIETKLLDHVIITDNGYYSFAEDGML